MTTLIDINKLDLLIGVAINGIFTGIGVTIGNYFANNHLIKKSQKLKRRIKKHINGSKK